MAKYYLYEGKWGKFIDKEGRKVVLQYSDGTITKVDEDLFTKYQIVQI